MKNLKQLLAIGILMFVAAAHGATDGQSSATEKGNGSNRMSKRFGASVGIVGEPHPSILGMNVNYNMTDFARATVGYGEATVGFFGLEGKMTTIGAGIVGTLPDWNFTPTAGLHVSSVSASSAGLEYQGIGAGTLLYGSVGFDWQTQGGFNMSAGMNIPMSKGSTGMYAALGWFFL